MQKNRAIILDRDGTILIDLGYVHKIEDFKLYPNTTEALKLLKDFKFFIITNQSGIGRGIFSEEDFYKFNDHLVNELKKEGLKIEKTYFCKHTPEENCDCRKPSIKFIKEIEKNYKVDLENSYVIGDHPIDIEMGNNAGCKTVYVLTDHGEKHITYLDIKSRPTIIRKNLLDAAKWINEENIKI